MASLFLGFGMSLPFLGRWLQETHGLSGIEIALVLSSGQLARLIVGPLIAAWADGFADRNQPLRILAVTGAGLYALFFWVDGLIALILAGFLAQSSLQAIMPLVEGAALRASASGAPGGLSYGVSRAIGSMAFIVANLAGGFLIASHGIHAATTWILVCFIGAAVVALVWLKPDPLPPTTAKAGYRARLREGGRLFARPAYVRTLAAGALIQCAHAFYYGFSTLIWTGQGLSDGLIGALWGFAVGVEVIFLWFLARIEKRFAPEVLLAVGGVGAVVRWVGLGLAPAAWALWPLQALHALSFAATHVGAMRIVQRETPAEIAGLGLTFYAASTATGLGLATLCAGALYDSSGVKGYFVMAAIAACGASRAVAGMRKRA